MSSCLWCLTDVRPVEVEPVFRVLAPPPGAAVLACACGRVLDADEMFRLPPSRDDARYFRPIVCRECADRPRPNPWS